MSNDDVIRALQEHAEKAAASAMQQPPVTFRLGNTPKEHEFAAPTGFAGHVVLYYALPGDQMALEFARIVANGCWIVNWNMTAQVANAPPVDQATCEGVMCRAIAQALIAARGNLREVTVEQGMAICQAEYQRLRAIWLASLSPEQRAALD